jgi:uncharacterized protein
MIKITSIDGEGRINERLWDNRACDFMSLDGTKIAVDVDIPEDERERLKKEGDGRHGCCENPSDELAGKAAAAYWQRARFGKTTMTKSRNVASLRIQMGMRCNYQCQYCKQATHSQYDAKTDIADAERFIENFASICTTDRLEPINIQLWGGEPLLYWPVMTRLGEFFRKEFKNARITVLSNGSLLNREKADWFLDNNIVLAVSHDGPGQLDYRSGDPLAEGSESLESMRYYAGKAREPLYFNAVITKDRYDLVGIVNYIKEKIGKNTRVGFEGIVLVEDEQQFDETTMFSDDDYLLLRREISRQLVAGQLNEIGIFRSKINALMSAIIAGGFNIPEDSQQKCSMDSPYNLSVDLKGNILACHSTPKPIGHVDDFEKASLAAINFIHWHKREECLNCPVLVLCRGGCLAQDASAFYHSCNNEFHYNLIFFEAVFQLFFGETIIAMDGVVRPTKQDFVIREHQNPYLRTTAKHYDRWGVI